MDNEIRLNFPGGLRVEAEIRGFTVATDQPHLQGGGASAPAPFDLFLASIASCAGFYVLSFLRSRHMNMAGTSVVMRTEKNQETRRIDRILIDVRLPAGFPDKYRRAVIKAVDSCAVKKHILEPPEFVITASSG